MGYDYSKSIDKNGLIVDNDLLGKLNASALSKDLNISGNKSGVNNYDAEREKNTIFLMNTLGVLEKRLKIWDFSKAAKMFLLFILFSGLMLSSLFASSVFMFWSVFFVLIGVFKMDVYDSITDQDPGNVAIDMLKKKLWAENQAMLNKMTYMDADIWVENKLLSILTKNDYIDENEDNLNNYVVRQVSSGVSLKNVLEALLISYSNRFLAENKKKYKNIMGVIDYYERGILRDKKNDLR